MIEDISPLVLDLDCSTTACKAIIWGCRGKLIVKGYSALAVLAPQPAWHEQPAESWRASMTHSIRQAVSQVDGRRLKALCIAHQRETFVPLDEQDRPLMNGILWMDVREASQEMTHILSRPIEPNAVDHAFYSRLFEVVFRSQFPALQLYLD